MQLPAYHKHEEIIEICILFCSLIGKHSCGLQLGLKKCVIWQKNSWKITFKSTLDLFSSLQITIFSKSLMYVKNMRRNRSKLLMHVLLIEALCLIYVPMKKNAYSKYELNVKHTDKKRNYVIPLSKYTLSKIIF